MDSTREHLEQQQNRGTGLAQEFRQLTEDGSASAAELQEFLSHLRGRSPEEVMGVVAQSGLIRSTLTATVGCVVLLAVFTVVPYALRDSAVTAKKDASAPSSNDSATTNADAAPAESETAGSSDTTAASNEPDLERAADAMGISGAAEADADTDSLDNKLEKLLDGIE